MDKEESKKEKLLKDITGIFMTYGIKSMTMDDIARHLHISKKTLYHHFTDKSALVLQCMEYECSFEESSIKKIIAQGLNAIDENIEISRFVLGQIQQVHPSIFYDLEKYHPGAFALMMDSRQGFTGGMIHSNIVKGIEEGYFRDDIHVEIATHLWISRINAIFNPAFFPLNEFDLGEVYQQMFTQQIRGLSSEKGLRYLEERIEPKLKQSKL